jgi:hypothetical protein
MALVTAHSLGFWGVWLAMGEWRAEALDFGARWAGVLERLAGGACCEVRVLNAAWRAPYAGR